MPRVETATAPMGKMPPGLGWMMWSGNNRFNEWWRVVRDGMDDEGETRLEVLNHTEHWTPAA